MITAHLVPISISGTTATTTTSTTRKPTPRLESCPPPPSTSSAPEPSAPPSSTGYPRPGARSRPAVNKTEALLILIVHISEGITLRRAVRLAPGPAVGRDRVSLAATATSGSGSRALEGWVVPVSDAGDLVGLGKRRIRDAERVSASKPDNHGYPTAPGSCSHRMARIYSLLELIGQGAGARTPRAILVVVDHRESEAGRHDEGAGQQPREGRALQGYVSRLEKAQEQRRTGEILSVLLPHEISLF